MSSAQSLFMVIRRYGPPYDREKPLEAQPEWEAHQVFMNALEAKGVARLGGPLEGGDDVLLIFRAGNKDEIERDLAADPWTPPTQTPRNCSKGPAARAAGIGAERTIAAARPNAFIGGAWSQRPVVAP